MLDYSRIYAELSTYRTLAIVKANTAISHNYRSDYNHAEEMYETLNGIINRNFGLIEKHMPHEEFPEWPAPEMRPVFSDEEIASWPVVFSDGSAIDDVVDVPF